MAVMGKWRLGLMAVEIIGRVTPAVLEVVEEHTEVSPDEVALMVKTRIDDYRVTWTRVSNKTVSLFIEAISSLLTDLES